MADNSLKLQGEFYKRKADEIYSSVAELHAYNVAKMQKTRQQTANLAELVAIADGENLLIKNASGKEFEPSNFAYSKLVQAVGGSMPWFDKLDASMIAKNLNYGFKACVKQPLNNDKLEPWQLDESGRIVDTNCKLISLENGSNELINVTGARYNLVFDAQLSELGLKLEEKFGLLPAPANKGHHGLYASDRDCFLFLSTLDKPVLTFANSPIYRGVMLWNGFDSTLGVSLFLLSGVCSNYSIHQFTEKYSIEARHSAKLWEKVKFNDIAENLAKAFDADTQIEQKFLTAATTVELAQDDEGLVEVMLSLRDPLLGKKASERIIELAKESEGIYGNPRTPWSIGNVVTEIGRDRPFASARRAYMQTAQRIFDLAA